MNFEGIPRVTVCKDPTNSCKYGQRIPNHKRMWDESSHRLQLKSQKWEKGLKKREPSKGNWSLEDGSCLWVGEGQKAGLLSE